MKTPSLHQLSPLALLPCFLAPASAATVCTPAALPSADMISLQGNCIDTITNAQLSQGAEVWRVRSGGASEAVGQRVLPGGTLSVPAPTIPGEYTYFIERIDQGYGGPINFGGEAGYPSVTVTIDDACNPPVELAAAHRARSSARRGPMGPDGCSGQLASVDQLTTTLTTLQTERMRSHLGNAEARLRLLRSKRTTPQIDVQGVALPQEAAAPANRRLGVYIMGLDDYLRRAGSSDQYEFSARTDSVSIGADYRLNDDWVMGANLGLSDSHVSFAGSASDQKSRGNQVTAYASWSPTLSTYLSATVSYEASRFNLVRDDGTGLNSFATPRGHGLGVSLSGGRDFVMGAWSVGPYLRWDSITSEIDAFDETGSESAVSVSSQRTRSNTLNLGAQTQLSIPVSWGIVLPHVRVELSRRKDATPRAPTATLLSDNTTLLIPTAAEADRSYGSVAFGVSALNQSGVSWFADYESSVAQKNYRTRRFSLGLRVEL